ncbi:MAG: mechanosensitive ion channel family protein [Gemmatimonadaceae bacterium]
MDWLPFSLDPDQVQAALLHAAPRVVAALVVLFAFWLLLRITRRPIRAALRRAHFADGLITLLVDGLYQGLLLLFAVVMAASQLGINVSALLAGVGVASIAVGFAAQETVANMIAGFLIFWDRPFQIGDYITTQGRYGEVREITLRTTRVRTLDNTFVVIPNRQIIGDTLVNHSMYGETRVVVPVGIAYKERIAAARDVLLAAARGVEGVLSSPHPDVVAESLGDSSVNLLVRVWVDDASQERPIAARVLEACKVALDDAGIQIPFPHRQLFLENVDDRVWAGAAAIGGGDRRL